MVADSGYIIGTIVVYMGICLLLGFLAWRRTHNLSDFILGGRSLGSWVTALSAQATDMSGWLLMGLPGLAYASGFDAVWMSLGLAVGTWANWRFVAAPLRARTESLQDALTLPDYFERRFDDSSRALRTISALLILVFFLFYTSSGFVAAGKLFETLFGIPYAWAMLCGTVVLLAYTFFGGFLAVSWSDVLQGTLMFFALVLVALTGVFLSGGVQETLEGIQSRSPELLEPFAAEEGALGLIAIVSLLAWGLGYPGQPHILARFMAIKTPAHLLASRRVAMTWVIIVLTAAVVVGLAGTLVLPQTLSDGQEETVFVRMSTTLLHPVFAGICLSGILAAVMSTAAAQLLVASAAFAQDLYKGLVRQASGGRELLWIGRCAVLVISLLAFWLALNPDNTVLALVSWAWAGFGAAFGPTIVLSLYWPRMTRNGALAGMLTGGLTVMLWKQGSGPLFELYEMIPGVLLSLCAIWIASVIDHRKLMTTRGSMP